jgi:hypothetical protein
VPRSSLQKLRAMPVMSLRTPTLCLVGAPNVGKSSLVRILSSGKPEVCLEHVRLAIDIFVFDFAVIRVQHGATLSMISVVFFTLITVMKCSCPPQGLEKVGRFRLDFVYGKQL